MPDAGTGTSLHPLDTSTVPARNTNRLDVSFTSSLPDQSQTPSWPPFTIDINIQNTIIFTTTYHYAPHTWADVVTVTSTATVVTTVPCSTDGTSVETITAKVLQILIVPSPVPYLDPVCACSKTDIVYVNDQSHTKTIYVQPASPVLLPTRGPDLVACTECYYTVRKTKTVTATCTAAPAPSPANLSPTFVGGAAAPSAPLPATVILGLSVLLALLW